MPQDFLHEPVPLLPHPAELLRGVAHRLQRQADPVIQIQKPPDPVQERFPEVRHHHDVHVRAFVNIASRERPEEDHASRPECLYDSLRVPPDPVIELLTAVKIDSA